MCNNAAYYIANMQKINERSIYIESLNCNIVTESYGSPDKGKEQLQRSMTDETKLAEEWQCGAEPFKKYEGSNVHFHTSYDDKANGKVTYITKVAEFEPQGVIYEVKCV